MKSIKLKITTAKDTFKRTIDFDGKEKLLSALELESQGNLSDMELVRIAEKMGAKINTQYIVTDVIELNDEELAMCKMTELERKKAGFPKRIPFVLFRYNGKTGFRLVEKIASESTGIADELVELEIFF